MANCVQLTSAEVDDVTVTHCTIFGPDNDLLLTQVIVNVLAGNLMNVCHELT